MALPLPLTSLCPDNTWEAMCAETSSLDQGEEPIPASSQPWAGSTCVLLPGQQKTIPKDYRGGLFALGLGQVTVGNNYS